MKTCSKCNIEQPYSNYNGDKTKPDGYYSSCKPCKQIKDYKWVEKNPDKVRVIADRFAKSEKGRASAIKNARIYKENHKEKFLAHKAVQQKVKHGTMVKPKTCQNCKKDVEGARLEGHHYLGYSLEHRFDVRWLCRQCHRKAHA